MCIFISETHHGWAFINDLHLPVASLEAEKLQQSSPLCFQTSLCAQQGLVFGCFIMNEPFPCPVQICFVSIQHFYLLVNPF